MIRHGRSLGNDLMDQPGNRWGDPEFRDDASLLDASLSEVGVRQAQELSSLAGGLQDMAKVELVVVSPLTRTLQTMQHAVLPQLPNDVPIIVHPLSTERVYTASDTGRRVSELRAEFDDSRINFDLVAEDTNWWFHTDNPSADWRPCDAQQWYAVPGEPQDVFEARLDKFEEWLATRPEKYICLVSHWAVLRHLTGGTNFGNCEAQWIKWQPKHVREATGNRHW